MISRYARADMVALWSPEARLRRWRDVELAALEGLVKVGLAPAAALQECLQRAGDFDARDVERIDEIERTTKHDVIAFLTFMEQRIGPAARFLHLGMTSSDVLDTALAMTLRDAADLILEDIRLAMIALEKRALEHKHTKMVGRSHGIHAEPTTFGLVLTLWFEELRRGAERLRQARQGIAVGMISGAVGTFAHVPPAVEAHVCQTLGLVPEPISNQVIQRDRHAAFFCALAVLGASIEKFAVQIRHLQRTEVREAEEPFTAGQKGSSAMPHKRNPILSENLSGLARLLRGYAVSAMENVALWHERDISHSSVERVIGPDATVTLDFMLGRFTGLVNDLRVYPERMAHNLGLLKGVIHSQAVLLALAQKGMDRQAAYGIVQRAAMRTYDSALNFEQALLEDAELAKAMSAQDVRACLAQQEQLQHVDAIFARVYGR